MPSSANMTLNEVLDMAIVGEDIRFRDLMSPKERPFFLHIRVIELPPAFAKYRISN
jgi:hypothetical protein